MQAKHIISANLQMFRIMDNMQSRLHKHSNNEELTIFWSVLKILYIKFAPFSY
jgi:hypothetical protein